VVDPVVGIVGGVATVLSFTPLAPVAAPIAIGSGVYLAGRTAFKQADYLNHGGEWGDRESLMNMGMIAATALPVGGSALRSIGMVRAGIPGSRALPGSIGALPMRSGTVTLAGREFAYNASPYAAQVANYTRTAGGLNMAAHGLDATAMAVGAPLVVQSGVDLAMHGGDMSGLELANSVLGLGTGVMGTGAGVRTIASYRPGRGPANPPETPGQQVPVLEPDAIIIPGENGGPEQIVVRGSTRSTRDLTPIAGRGNPDIVRVRAEDGQMVDAVVLGDQPAGADAIFVPKQGDVPRPQDVAGKTHVLLRDPATGAPLICLCEAMFPFRWVLWTLGECFPPDINPRKLAPPHQRPIPSSRSAGCDSRTNGRLANSMCRSSTARRARSTSPCRSIRPGHFPSPVPADATSMRQSIPSVQWRPSRSRRIISGRPSAARRTCEKCR
jgi:hypothetical protein